MIFLDSNIPMYVVGAAHPHKLTAQRLLERAVRDEERMVTSAEVLQEILHRYVRIDRRDAIEPTFNVLLRFVDEVFPVTLADAQRAKDIALRARGLSARDALHVAVMEQHGIARIMTFDAEFDRWPGVTRVATL